MVLSIAPFLKEREIQIRKKNSIVRTKVIMKNRKKEKKVGFNYTVENVDLISFSFSTAANVLYYCLYHLKYLSIVSGRLIFDSRVETRGSIIYFIEGRPPLRRFCL